MNFGTVCIAVPLAYVVLYCLFYNEIILLAVAGVYALIIGGIVAGIIGGLNVFGTGLNSTATGITFVITLGMAFYTTLITSAYGNTGMPYEAIFDIVLSTIYGIGLYMLASGKSEA